MLSYCPHYRAKSLSQSLQLSASRMEENHHNVSYWQSYRDKDPERDQQWLAMMKSQLKVSDSHMPRHREAVARFCRENPDHSSASWLMSELGRLEFMLQETHRLITHWITDTPDTHTHRMHYALSVGFKNREGIEENHGLL